MKRITRFFLIACVLLMSSCGKIKLQESARDHFFLKNDGATMPVYVYGNTRSKVFIVQLHGGPGASSILSFQAERNPFTKLQQDYAVVYWDQRGAGISQGNIDYNKLTLSDYTEDLEQLIFTLKALYGDDITLFLLGHSWGGALGIQYLAKEENRNQINGWIEVDGGHNVPRIIELERELIEEVGERQIALGNHTAEWQRLIDQANSFDLSAPQTILDMNSVTGEGENLMTEIDSITSGVESSVLNDLMLTPVDIFSMIGNSGSSVNSILNELSNLNLEPELQSITTPTLLIWGKYDFSVPPTLAEEALPLYGSSDKALVIFETSGHSPQYSEPDKFYNVVDAFIRKHR